MDKEDVGSYYTTNGKDIWQLICFSSEPTATMLNIKTGEKISGTIGCPNLKPFIKLVPEKRVNNRIRGIE